VTYNGGAAGSSGSSGSNGKAVDLNGYTLDQSDFSGTITGGVS